jgi:hypothetical protein
LTSRREGTTEEAGNVRRSGPDAGTIRSVAEGAFERETEALRSSQNPPSAQGAKAEVNRNAAAVTEATAVLPPPRHKPPFMAVSVLIEV